jgi:hypothetical protein
VGRHARFHHESVHFGVDQKCTVTDLSSWPPSHTRPDRQAIQARAAGPWANPFPPRSAHPPSANPPTRACRPRGVRICRDPLGPCIAVVDHSCRSGWP